MRKGDRVRINFRETVLRHIYMPERYQGKEATVEHGGRNSAYVRTDDGNASWINSRDMEKLPTPKEACAGSGRMYIKTSLVEIDGKRYSRRFLGQLVS